LVILRKRYWVQRARLYRSLRSARRPNSFGLPVTWLPVLDFTGSVNQDLVELEKGRSVKSAILQAPRGSRVQTICFFYTDNDFDLLHRRQIGEICRVICDAYNKVGETGPGTEEMLRNIGGREAPAGSSLLSPERKRHAMRCPGRALLPGCKHWDSGVRVSFLDLFLS